MTIVEFITARLDEREPGEVCGCLDANHWPSCTPQPTTDWIRRDIEAKRAIMKLYEEHGGLLWHAVAAIAAIDRDHPDFSPDWRQSC